MVSLGAVVVMAGETKLPYGQIPIMLHNGEVTLQTSSGKVATLMLDTHNFEDKLQDQSPEEVRAIKLKTWNKLVCFTVRTKKSIDVRDTHV